MSSQRTLYHVAQLYRLLPPSFLRKYAVKQVAPKIYLKERTVDKYLSILIQTNFLKREKNGYVKSILSSKVNQADVPLYNI